MRPANIVTHSPHRPSRSPRCHHGRSWWAWSALGSPAARRGRRRRTPSSVRHPSAASSPASPGSKRSARLTQRRISHAGTLSASMPRAEDTPAHGCGRDGLPGDDRSIDRRPQRDGPESQAPGHLVGRGRRTASPPGQDCPLDLSHTPGQGTPVARRMRTATIPSRSARWASVVLPQVPAPPDGPTWTRTSQQAHLRSSLTYPDPGTNVRSGWSRSPRAPHGSGAPPYG